MTIVFVPDFIVPERVVQYFDIVLIASYIYGISRAETLHDPSRSSSIIDATADILSGGG